MDCSCYHLHCTDKKYNMDKGKRVFICGTVDKVSLCNLISNYNQYFSSSETKGQAEFPNSYQSLITLTIPEEIKKNFCVFITISDIQVSTKVSPTSQLPFISNCRNSTGSMGSFPVTIIFMKMVFCI